MAKPTLPKQMLLQLTNSASWAKGLACALFISTGVIACARVPERPPEGEARNIESHRLNHPEGLNVASANPSDATLKAWLLELEDDDVAVFSRAKTRLHPKVKAVTRFLAAGWLADKSPKTNDFVPKNDDAVASCVDLMMSEFSRRKQKPAWSGALINEIISWFHFESGAARRPMLLVQGLANLEVLGLEEKGALNQEVTNLALLCIQHRHSAIRWRASKLLLDFASTLDVAMQLKLVKILESSSEVVRRDAARTVLGLWARVAPKDLPLRTPRPTFNPDADAETRSRQILALEQSFNSLAKHKGE